MPAGNFADWHPGSRQLHKHYTANDLKQLGNHLELYDKYVESEAKLGVLVRALRRVVKYRMTAKKAQETIEEALTTIGMA
jgi:hypothetical protein